MPADTILQFNQLPGRLYTSVQVRELDRVAIEDFGIKGITLMRRAASACVDAILEFYPSSKSVAVFCGSGNNAGDGYIIAGMLAEKGMDVTCYEVGDTAKLGSDATEAFNYCATTDVKMCPWDVTSPVSEFAGIDLIVDALLGTGLAGGVRSPYLEVIGAINETSCAVLSVDIPSGLNADTGEILGAAIEANLTVTFIGLKRGLFTLDGPDVSGRVLFNNLDVPPDVYSRVEGSVELLSLDACRVHLPVRPKNAHKNQFGHVLVVGGDAGMGGAVAMSAEAALRAGAGLVSVATHPDHASALLARRPELMVRGIRDAKEVEPLLERASVIVLGPGLGRSDWSLKLWRKVLDRSEDQVLVVDADGLNLLAQNPGKRDNWILTPHPGEASNLLQDNRIQSDRFASVTRIREKYGGVSLLKGAGTVIDDGERLSLCPFGNPGMSTAGMGDVLSGVLAGLVAQGIDPGNATRLGVVVHALAGDACASDGERGIAATDLLPHIRRLLNP